MANGRLFSAPTSVDVSPFVLISALALWLPTISPATFTRSGSSVRSLCTPLYLHLSSLVFVSWTSKGEIGRVLNRVHRSPEGPRYICLPHGGQRFTNPGTWGWNYHSSDLSSPPPAFLFLPCYYYLLFFFFRKGRGRDAYRLRVCGITQRPANVTYAAASWIFCNGV